MAAGFDQLPLLRESSSCEGIAVQKLEKHEQFEQFKCHTRSYLNACTCVIVVCVCMLKLLISALSTVSGVVHCRYNH
jgi:hypothetical protein